MFICRRKEKVTNSESNFVGLLHGHMATFTVSISHHQQNTDLELLINLIPVLCQDYWVSCLFGLSSIDYLVQYLVVLLFPKWLTPPLNFSWLACEPFNDPNTKIQIESERIRPNKPWKHDLLLWIKKSLKYHLDVNVFLPFNLYSTHPYKYQALVVQSLTYYAG